MKKIIYIANVDWYFCLHWMERATAAKESGYEVHIAVPSGKDSKAIRDAGFQLIEIPLKRKGRNLLEELKTFYFLYSIIKELSPSLVHTLTVKPNIHGALASAMLGIPVVVSITGLGHVFTQKSMKYRALRFLIQKVYRFISFIGQNIFVFENYEDYRLLLNSSSVNAKNARVILGAGVDVDNFKVEEFPQGTTKILLAARMLWGKGIQDILDAEAILRSRGVNFEIYFAGILDKDSVGAISEEEISNWHDQGRIIWLGQRSDMPTLISKSHISILPTCYGEGIPRFLIESACCGRPIVATDVAGCREIVIDGVTGYLVPPRDSVELANAIQKLIESPELCRIMGAEGRKLVEDKMSGEIVIRSTLAAYEELVQHSSSK